MDPRGRADEDSRVTAVFHGHDTAGALVQLAIPLDALDDNPGPAERAAVEARIEDDDRRRALGASRAPACQCARSWPMGPDARCIRCGRSSHVLANGEAPAP
jgi:hypothetical protein